MSFLCPAYTSTTPSNEEPHQWIDTCCIDKSSSAELSEAINSMFRWYGDAEVCYAFLSDVDADENPNLLPSSFRNSRWFTRGWTLQELIAPGVVYFYGAGWEQIGSRDTLLDLIVSITKIHASYFTSGDVTQFSAAQKMAWASNRNTTRVEDAAYSLLGLFDINMPLLYGEGSRAFARLQEEILRQSEDDSLLTHNHADILAPSPWWFRHCAGVSRREAWPYRNNPSLALNRNLSLNRGRLTMTFPIVKLAKADNLSDFCSVEWPRDLAPQACVVALLSCGTSEASAALVLFETARSVYAKLPLPMRGMIRAALESRLMRRVEVVTVSLARAKGGGEIWKWRAGNKDLFLGEALTSQARTDARSAGLYPIMTPIVRPEVVGRSAADVEDGLRDKIVVKGPGKAASGFEVRYVYVAGFRLTWLERENEVHLLPSTMSNWGRPCVVFSSVEGQSFMVALMPTRTSVNADLYTDIPPWEGEPLLGYMPGLDRERKARKGESPCYRGTQLADDGKRVEVQIQSRRRNNGWWVYVTVTQPTEDDGGE